MDNVPLGHPGDTSPPGWVDPTDLSEAISWLHESAAEIAYLKVENMKLKIALDGEKRAHQRECDLRYYYENGGEYPEDE